MGRRRIQIEKIENKNARSVCFSKRRKGLFKKAEEFRGLFDNVGVFCAVFSPAGKPFVFGDPRLVLDSDLIPPPFASASETESLIAPTSAAFVDDDLEYISGLSLSELEEYSSYLEEMGAAVVDKLDNGGCEPKTEPIVEEIHYMNTINNTDVVDSVGTKQEEEAVASAVVGYGVGGEDYDELYGLLGGDYNNNPTTMIDHNSFYLDQESVPLAFTTMMDNGAAQNLGVDSIGEEMAYDYHQWFSAIGDEMMTNAVNAENSWIDEMLAKDGTIVKGPEYDFMNDLLLTA